MILVDRALQARAAAGNPIRVGMIGAGFMGRGIANQIVNAVPGIRLCVICNRKPAGAAAAYAEAGIDDPVTVRTVGALEDAIRGGRYAVTDSAAVVCESDSLQAIIEVTGDVGFGAEVVLQAIAHRKHVILMNAELGGTLGPILKVYADRAGVIVTECDGDQPGVQMNLFRFVQGLGLRPLVCGNNKGLQDPYRNPDTQQEFARKWGQKPHMVSSFADGTKMSFEQAVVANATGLTVARRGMNGWSFPGHFDELTARYDVDELERLGGIVDYVVGAKPAPGVFIFATHHDPRQRHYLALYKLGPGPLYSFYTPYHLCHFELPHSVVRAVDFADPVLVPAGASKVEVVTTAKTRLQAGSTLDGIGYYMTYGQCERAEIAQRDRLLPIGLAEGCRLLRAVERDEVISYADVELPVGRLSDRLRAEQDRTFFPQPIASPLPVTSG